jgi:predicted nucleotidyltransferase
MKEQRPDLFIAEAVERTMAVIMNVYTEEQIISAALYGSAAKGNFVTGLSDINLFVVIRDESADRLLKAAQSFGTLLEDYRVKLLLMTSLELQESADMFPLEYLEMRETQRILHGEDLLTPLVIDRSHYRHQVEGRLRGSITTLRQLILTSGSRKKGVLEQFLIWSGKQDTLFRALIRLRDEHLLQQTGQEAGPRVAITVAGLYDVDPDVLKAIYDDRDEPKDADVSRQRLAKILMAYEALAHAVNVL